MKHRNKLLPCSAVLTENIVVIASSRLNQLANFSV